MPQLFCILEESGRSLLTRAIGDIQTPSFPTVGLLCTIATYSDSSGFDIDNFGSHNVKVVYRRFPNGLLFVLATSNGLAHTQMLQGQLQVVYDALSLLLGAAAMNIDKGSDGLRKKLRGITCIDLLIADDSSVPCLMLPVPQVMGLALRDKAMLHGCLIKLAAAAGTKQMLAAIVRDGLYLAATADWWQLQPREALLLQHFATFPSDKLPRDLPVHLSVNDGGSGRRSRLLTFKLENGLQLLLVVADDGLSIEALDSMLDVHLIPVRHLLQEPLSYTPVVPQFASLGFHAALVLEQQPACGTLLWGQTPPHMSVLWGPAESPPPHARAASASATASTSAVAAASAATAATTTSPPPPAGLHPLMSPTFRRFMVPSPNSRSTARDATSTSSDNMHLYFKSTVDLLMTFAIQCQQQQQQQQQAHRGKAGTADGANAVDPSAATAAGPGTTVGGVGVGGGGGVAAAGGGATVAGLAAPLAVARDSASGQDSQDAMEEFHVTNNGSRMVGLLDPRPQGLAVFMVLPVHEARSHALEVATNLRAIFCMSYISE